MVFFVFCPDFDRIFCKQTVETLISVFAASELGLHCLLMSHKKDARLICVKLCYKRHNIKSGCLGSTPMEVWSLW